MSNISLDHSILLVDDLVVKFKKAYLVEGVEPKDYKLKLNLIMSKASQAKSPLNEIERYVVIRNHKFTFIKTDRIIYSTIVEVIDYVDDFVEDIDDLYDDKEYVMLTFAISEIKMEIFEEKLKLE